MTAHALRRAIESTATSLGFDRVGFAPAGPCRDTVRLEHWLEQGHHGEMGWMERSSEVRSDPRRLLAGARTVIALLTFYDVAGGEDWRGRISRYAWGRDYHNVLGRRLKKMVRAIEELAPGSRTVAAVDSRPILEKEWAERAGLGWIGKHSNLITTDRGSWFFLSELVTDLELPAQETRPVSRCGTCDDCIRACPTGAIVAPHVVDARRCISYLTIELDGPIPRELRPSVGEWMFGCDVCQDVCPWNRFSVPIDEADFEVDRGRFDGDPSEFLSLSDDEFLARFEGSPVRRAGRNGFLRNVCVALGNRRDPSLVPPLARAIRDASALVRSHAAWALGRIATDDAIDALRGARSSEGEPAVVEEIDAALSEALA